MMTKPYLKHQNQPIVRRYIWAVVGSYLLVIGVANISEFHLFLSKPEEADGIWRMLVPLASAGLYLFLDRLITTELKEILIFWRLKERLPGHRAFSTIASKDPRISVTKLEKLHGSLPRDSKEQNELWYMIYRKHKDEDEIRDPNGSYLLYRELTYINLAVGLVLLLPSIALGSIRVDVGFGLLAVSVLLSLILSLNAKSSAKRLVQNVLAVESSDNVDTGRV